MLGFLLGWAGLRQDCFWVSHRQQSTSTWIVKEWPISLCSRVHVLSPSPYSPGATVLEAWVSTCLYWCNSGTFSFSEISQSCTPFWLPLHTWVSTWSSLVGCSASFLSGNVIPSHAHVVHGLSIKASEPVRHLGFGILPRNREGWRFGGIWGTTVGRETSSFLFLKKL